jgi:4-amino-4-deoxy-L-arabinose transferase-like glycosyltransferase
LALNRQWLVAGARPIAAWYDSPTDRAVLILLALCVAVWTAFQVVAYTGTDLHPDVVEVFAWGQHPYFGYHKHPPLGALMAAAWFAIFPVTDWSAHLMAMSNGALALFCVDLIARRYVTGDKRLLLLLLLLLTPIYQFHAVRFGSNQTLLPTWPLATYCFLRAYESRGTLWGAAAGAAAALAMLGKYFSIYLVGALVVAALVHPARWRYLRSPSPWASIIVGLLLLAPHIRWLVAAGFQPFDYAVLVHGHASFLQGAIATVGYVFGSIGYLIIPIAALMLAARPNPMTVARALWPSNPDHRMLAVILYGVIVLPVVTAPFGGMMLTSIWVVQGLYLLPLLLLLPEDVTPTRPAAIGVTMAVVAITAVLLLVSPLLAWFKFVQGSPQMRLHYRQAALELTQAWHAVTPSRLAIVMGDQDFAFAVTFYSPDRPDSGSSFDLRTAPWVTRERLAREGFAVVCRSAGCVTQAMQLAAGHPGAHKVEVDIVPRLFGLAGAPERFVFVLAPPRP